MTADRPMTPRLRGALDSLTASQRNVLKVLADESEHPWLRGLLEGLVAEVVTEEMREVTVLHGLEVDAAADVDKAAEGADWSHVVPPEPRTEDWWPQGKP